jgi:hypothetical protein
MRQLPLALLLVPSAIACTTQANDSEQVTAALEQPNGGFDTADEAAMFGDADVFASAQIESDTAIDDSTAADPAIADMVRSTTARAHRLIVLWGRLPADRGADTARDWTGQLRISRGGLVVRRTIAFEDRTDHLLPRPSINTVAFASVTRPFVDGLALTVVDPTPDATDALTLTYAPADGSPATVLDLAKLADGPIVVDMGDGNKLVAVGRRHRADNTDPCDAGVMRGRWHALTPHLGVFIGVVADEDGTPIGHVRGIYGERKNGEKALFGKFINREGGFRGIMAGQFDGNGKFDARWLDRAGDHGVVNGVYFEGASLRAGAWAARWHETSCAAN